MVNIESVKKEYQEILEKLGDPELISDWSKFEILSKKKEVLEKIIAKQEESEDLKNQIEENKKILTDQEDRELAILAEEELKNLIERQKILQIEIENLKSESEKGNEIQNSEKSKNTGVIVEIRAGTGGEESALFAADLFRMYTKYAVFQNWKQKILDSRPTGLGGFKEIIFELEPERPGAGDGDILAKMKYEAGVHRVQRIPKTEKSGRIHTSTTTVAVLPKPKKAAIKINPGELKIEFYRASGPGGQYVNKRETAVRVTHLPSGIVVTSQSERNQLQNKENAMSILSAKILEQRKINQETEFLGKRKTQIGWAKRAEKIRTYNFPQDRLTDHRVKKTWHNLEKILAGDLEPIISFLQKSEADGVRPR